MRRREAGSFSTADDTPVCSTTARCPAGRRTLAIIRRTEGTTCGKNFD